MAGSILGQTKDILSPKGINANNLIALISAGIHLLILHKDQSTYCWLDLNDASQQKEFINDLDWLIKRVFDNKKQHAEAERIAINCINKGFEYKLISELTGLTVEHLQKL